MPAAPEDWRRTGQERELTGVVVEHRAYGPPRQEGLRAWRSPSRGIVVEGFADDPPAGDLLAARVGIDDWEEVQPARSWDHDHCVFCWVAFEEPAKVAASPPADRDVATCGYLVLQTEAGSRKWICEECFEDFREEFRWSVAETKEGSSG